MTDYDNAYDYAVKNLKEGCWSIAEQYYDGRNETLLILYDSIDQEYETEIIDFTGTGE